jgi:hypothetical protein
MRETRSAATRDSRNTDADKHHLLGGWGFVQGDANTVNGVFGHAFTAVFGIPECDDGAAGLASSGAAAHAGTGGVTQYAARGPLSERRPMKTGRREHAYVSFGDGLDGPAGRVTIASGLARLRHTGQTGVHMSRSTPANGAATCRRSARPGTCWLRPGNGFAGIAVGRLFAVWA